MLGSEVEDIVSRETLDELKDFSDFVLKWNRSIQLVSRGDQAQLWSRHILDSVQWVKFLDQAGSCVDIGSGGGFPGIVWAILGKSGYTDRRFTLVERDIRKAAFLRACKSRYGLACEVISDDVRNISGEEFDLISARALASIADLLEMTQGLSSDQGVYMLPKGKGFQRELEDAKRDWNFSWSSAPSLIDRESQMIFIRDVQHV